MDTNALLSIAFSIISNFTNVVYVPPESVPRSTNDLATYNAGGGLNFPTTVGMRLKNGTRFSIYKAAVRWYEAPRSYFGLQDLRLISNYVGEARMTTNEVLDLATTTILRLARAPAPLTNSWREFRTAGPYRGKAIPFYQVAWYRTNSADPRRLSDLAEVEVDAERRQIVALWLPDPAFHDELRDEQIRREIHAPEPTVPPRPKNKTLPRAPTNEVARAIGALLALCPRMHIDPGVQTNVADIDWDDTYVYKDPSFRPARDVCVISFKNGTRFSAIGGRIKSYAASDKYFPMQAWKWKRFLGPINYRWEELAKDFQNLLVKEFQMQETLFAGLQVGLTEGHADEGKARRVNRAQAGWYEPGVPGSHGDLVYKLMVEFDLGSGAIKGFAFLDPAWIESFLRAQVEKSR